MKPRVLLAAAVLCAATLAPRAAFAGPPLVCFPFNIGQAHSLPMADMSHNWRAIDATYDATHLVDDTLALLGPSTPVIVRMETLRRATIYAGQNPKIGYALLQRIQARAKASNPDAALSLFDFGYLVETIRQAQPIFAAGVLPSVEEIDGFALIQKAMTFRHDPQIAFAAAIVAMHPRRAEYGDYVRGAEAAAKSDTLIASNMSSRFSPQ